MKKILAVMFAVVAALSCANEEKRIFLASDYGIVPNTGKDVMFL